jgi:SPP1 gp7 family putative phage head morphogenesis protein
MLIAAVKQVVDGMDIEGTIYDAVDRLNVAEMTRKIDGDLLATVRTLGIDKSDIDSDTIRSRINENLRDNFRRDIVNWDNVQTQRLRDMVQRAAQNGYSRRNMEKAIMDEWGVSEEKARFLARQETSLFFSAERRTQFENAGVKYYLWRCINDSRVRDRHKELDSRFSKKIYVFGNPPETSEPGEPSKHNEPGEDYGCRCIAIPVLSSEIQSYSDHGYTIYV